MSGATYELRATYLRRDGASSLATFSLARPGWRRPAFVSCRDDGTIDGPPYVSPRARRTLAAIAKSAFAQVDEIAAAAAAGAEREAVLTSFYFRGEDGYVELGLYRAPDAIDPDCHSYYIGLREDWDERGASDYARRIGCAAADAPALLAVCRQACAAMRATIPPAGTSI